MDKGLVLDMDGVIRHIDLDIAENVAKSLGFTYEEIMSTLWDNKYGVDLIRGTMTRREWWNAVSGSDGRLEGVSQDVIWNGLFEKSDIDRDLIDFISTLKQRFVTAVFTNCDEASKIQIIEELGPDHPFDFVISSSDIKFAKPEREAFQKLLRIIDVEPSLCFYFDDSINNVESALSIGINGHLFKNITQVKGIVNTSSESVP
ncbi:MAG: HAD family hydrolase [Candidatus Hodarchaeota archaeon]